MPKIRRVIAPVGMVVGTAHPIVHRIDPLVRLRPLLALWLESPVSQLHAEVDHSEGLGLLECVDDALHVCEAATAILAVVERHLRLLEVGVLQILAVPYLSDRVAHESQASCTEEALEAEHECSAIVVARAVRLQ